MSIIWSGTQHVGEVMETFSGCQISRDAEGRTTLRFTSFGFLAEISVSSDCSLSALEDYLPPYRKPGFEGQPDRAYAIESRESEPGGSTCYRLMRGLRLLHEGELLTDVLSAFESDLALAIATDDRHEMVFVHAGVVAWQHGAVVIPGQSRCGKSTLVMALVSAGGHYFSDEFAVFDSDGLVHPYQRVPSLRGADRWAQGTKTREDALMLERVAEPVVVQGVLLSSYASQARFSPQSMSSGRGVLKLLEHAVSAQLDPQRVLRSLVRAVEGVKVWEGERGEAAEVVEWMLARQQASEESGS